MVVVSYRIKNSTLLGVSGSRIHASYPPFLPQPSCCMMPRCGVGRCQVLGEMSRHLFVHADGVLGLVEDGLVLGVILAAGCLVAERLGGGLLAVWDEVTGGLVAGAGETLTDLVEGGLGGVWLGFVTDLCGGC